MKWVKSACWAIAWGVWVWLGVGLYRELPRELGEEVCRVDRPLPGFVLGFVGDGHEVAVAKGDFDFFSVAVYNAENGNEVRTFGEVRAIRPLRFEYHPVREDVRRLGILLSVGWGFEGEGVYAVDLRSGGSRFVGDFRWGETKLHPTRPWILVQSHQSGPPGCRDQIVVYDLGRGLRLFSRGNGDENFRCGEACFVGDSDDLVVTVRNRSPGEPGGTYERYELGGPAPILKASHRVPIVGSGPSASPKGLVASTHGDEDFIDVIDAPAGKVVLSDPPRELRRGYRAPAGPQPVVPPVILSRSGKTVVGGRPPRLWNLESGKVIWEGVGERWVTYGSENDRFGVFEDWGKGFGKPNQFVTVAWRDVETGRVLFRCWAKDYRSWERTSADLGLVVGNNGVVSQLPYRVNWLLFGICQFVLGLPIVLSCFVLWRRRKRQMMRVSGAAV